MRIFTNSPPRSALRKITCVAFTLPFDANKTASVYHNGVPAVQGTIPNAGGVAGVVDVYALSSATPGMFAEIFGFASWTRALYPEEARELASGPWVLAAKRQRFWYAPLMAYRAAEIAGGSTLAAVDSRITTNRSCRASAPAPAAPTHSRFRDCSVLSGGFTPGAFEIALEDKQAEDLDALVGGPTPALTDAAYVYFMGTRWSCTSAEAISINGLETLLKSDIGHAYQTSCEQAIWWQDNPDYWHWLYANGMGFGIKESGATDSADIASRLALMLAARYWDSAPVDLPVPSTQMHFGSRAVTLTTSWQRFKVTGTMMGSATALWIAIGHYTDGWTAGQGFPNFTGYSAGSNPTGRVHAEAIRQIAGADMPTDGLRSKSWDEFAKPGAPKIHFVFTVCDRAASEVCPVWPGHPLTARWSVPAETTSN